ncbi:MAG: two-component system sensor histidine kinase NtrB [Planctomycetota bacterium]|jgi:two-component system sensor histidine kinase PilS (NtrC family)
MSTVPDSLNPAQGKDVLRAEGQAVSREGVRLLLLVRFAVVALVACVMMIGRGRLPVFPYMPPSIFLILVLVLFYNCICWFLQTSIRQRHLFVLWQLALDTVAETGLLFFSGGVDSSFVPLYFASIVGSSMLVSRRENALSACFATMGLAAVTILHLTEVGAHLVPEAFRVDSPDMPRTWGRMLPMAAAFFTVAYLSGVLQARLAIVRIMNEEILQNMPEGVVVFDAVGRVVFLNAEFVRLFRQGGREPMVGDDLHRAFPGEEFGPLRAALKQARNWRFELEARSSKGEGTQERPPLEIRLAPIGDEAAHRGVVAIFIDISLRLQVEEAQRRADRSEAVGEMAAGLAHEIRNPLASVRGSIQEVASEFEDGSANRRLCDIVIKESDRLDTIITEFLQFARSRPLHLGPCLLVDLLNEVRDLLSTRASGVGVELDFDYEGDLPAVRGDNGQLREIFLNLGVNACSAMEGQGRLVVRAVLYDEGAEKPLAEIGPVPGVLIRFEDNGPGLLPGTEHRIFEPFYTTKPKGTGLGLATAQRVVQAHNGYLWVKSVRGSGTTFYCWLPFASDFCSASLNSAYSVSVVRAWLRTDPC